MDIVTRLAALEDSLKALRQELEPHLPVLVALQSVNGLPKKGTRVPKKGSRAQWRRQGKYLAAIRTLGKGDKAKVKRELRAKGYSAAIKMAKGLAG